MSSPLPKSVRFHPTEAELINYLKRFLKGESLPTPCPLRLADIYGDQPPWQLFGASEEKVCYFITPLKKRKISNQHYNRTCANGTWRGQTSGTPIKNRMETVVGFRRNFVYRSKEQEKNSTTTNWLMREYFVGDDFFGENNIPQQDFVVCRIKKNIKEKKVNDVAITYKMEEHDVAGIMEAMLHGPADDHCTTQPGKDQVMDETDQWDSIIDGVCNQQQIENTTTLIQGEYDLRGCNLQNDQILLNTYKANTENQNTTRSSTTLEQEGAYGQIEQVQGDEADDIGSNEFWEGDNGILEGIIVDVPDDLWQLDDQSSLLLD